MSVVEESAGALDKYLNSARPVAGRLRTSALGGLRFAFYGRTSTEDFQDPVSSRACSWSLRSVWWLGVV
ncbi:hypothetical protein H4W33_000381 [Kibdelosporangium phytohabitans]|nr:hypothetical protein [Kibdelosporangium phytohabitans]